MLLRSLLEQNCELYLYQTLEDNIYSMIRDITAVMSQQRSRFITDFSERGCLGSPSMHQSVGPSAGWSVALLVGC